jgi:hypothetical protein
LIECGDEKVDVDVRSQNLLVGDGPGDLASKCCRPRQEAVDEGFVLSREAVDDDPVPNDGQLG